jgi:outer membrane protein OmpA-like peptidoglycan-associated protein
VEITSNDPTLLRRALLKAERPAREENDVNIKLTTNESIDSWQVTIAGNGQRKSYGPFTGSQAYMDPTGLLNENTPNATFTAEVIAKTTDGRTLSDTEQFQLVLNKQASKASRHNLIFEYNDPDPVGRSREFIKQLAPSIPNGATVIVGGYTDNLGTESANLKLSQERAEEIRKELEQALRNAGKTNVSLRSAGYGEDPAYAPFKNDYPEGRMYNRTVIVDIIT